MKEELRDCVMMKMPHRIHSPEKLIEKLREVTLHRKTWEIIYAQNSDYEIPKPYKNAHITLEKIDPNILAPCQRYVLVSEIAKIQKVYWHMLNTWDIDIFNMAERNVGYIEGFSDPLVDILPIIVEEQIINGKLHMLICDGMHRAYYARQTYKLATVVYIRGASEPYYAYPVPGGWLDVEVLDEISPSYIKKFHAYEDYKEHFRDFTSVFNNMSVSRPRNPVEKST